MVKKTNVFNVIIILVAIGLVAIISTHYGAMEENTLTFSGPNIYRSVYVFEIMQEQGYEVLLTIDGAWTDTGEPFEGSGVILEAEQGQYLIDYSGNQVSVGGPQTGTEDLSASKLYLSPLHDSVVKVGIMPASFTTLSESISELNTLSYSLVPAENLYNVGIVGDVMLDTQEILSPTLVQEIDNILPPNNEIILYDKGIRLSFENAKLADLSEINSLLTKKGITVTAVATSRLELQVRSDSSIKEVRETLQQSAEARGFGIYLLRVINEPVV